MASVTFPTEYGGSGQTITDDANPSTGMLNGGHRQRWVPGLKGAVDMAQWTKLKADETNADRLIAARASSEAVSAKVSAEKDANTAKQAAINADSSAQLASSIYPNAVQGLSNTEFDQYFKVPENGYLQLYRNSNGAAEPIFKLASEETLIKLNAQPDPLLTSLLF